jgi:hypothetical protein
MTGYYVLAGISVAWALGLAAIGLTQKNFPPTGSMARALMGFAVVLSLVTMVVLVSVTHVEHPREEAAEAAEEAERSKGSEEEPSKQPPAEQQGEGAQESSSARGEAKTVPVKENEFSIEIAGGTTLEAGAYDFQVANDGKIEHDLAIENGGQPGALLGLNAMIDTCHEFLLTPVPELEIRLKGLILPRSDTTAQKLHVESIARRQSGVKSHVDSGRPIQVDFPPAILFDQVEYFPSFDGNDVSGFMHFFQRRNDAALFGAGKRVELILVPVEKQRREFIGGRNFVADRQARALPGHFPPDNLEFKTGGKSLHQLQSKPRKACLVVKVTGLVFHPPVGRRKVGIGSTEVARVSCAVKRLGHVDGITGLGGGVAVIKKKDEGHEHAGGARGKQKKPLQLFARVLHFRTENSTLSVASSSLL